MKKTAFIRFISPMLILGILIWSVYPIFNQEEENHTPENNRTVFSEAVMAPIDFDGKAPQNSAQSMALIDAKSRNIIFSKNSDVPRGMASTTKIMTALVAIENFPLEQEFSIPKEAVGIEGSSVYLKEGEKLTLLELLYCLLLESGNDAATAIAICCAGDVETFVTIMNERAFELGLENTYFSNPHGLSHENHKTTALELALITATAFEYPIFREIVSTKTAKVRYNGIENGRTLSNHNKLLYQYEGAIGVKTGYTMADGKCLVSCAERNGLTLIAVTLSDPKPNATHKALFDSAFENFENRIIANAGEISAEIPTENGEKEFLTVCNGSKIALCLPKNAKIEIQLVSPERVTTPVEKGDIIAKAKCFYQGKEVYIINLEATETIKKKKEENFFESLF